MSHAFLIIDLAFGDCGKGSIVDFLTRRHGPHTVVRFNGGPQAAHNVVTPDGRHHTFSQFGSGTFVPGVRTFLSNHVLIEPYALLNENTHLRQMGVHDALGRLLIDRRCAIITPAHQAANRIRELARANNAHGTCGVGLGEAMSDLLASSDQMITANEWADRPLVKRKLRALCDRKLDELKPFFEELQSHPRARLAIDTLTRPDWLDSAADHYSHVARMARLLDDSEINSILRSPGTILFEGAQGVLLDENFGFHPHTTWSTTTFANADHLLNQAGFGGPRTRIGVLRTYFTRHGPGPFVTEETSLDPLLPELHNTHDDWPGRFRLGTFDAVAARHALKIAGHVDVLALTHLDRVPLLPPRICTAYRFPNNPRPVTHLDLINPTDLPARTRQTATLFACQPIHTAIPPGPTSLIQTIEHELSTPILLHSHGPTATEKRWHER